jgi:hypothetical protein
VASSWAKHEDKDTCSGSGSSSCCKPAILTNIPITILSTTTTATVT